MTRVAGGPHWPPEPAAGPHRPGRDRARAGSPWAPSIARPVAVRARPAAGPAYMTLRSCGGRIGGRHGPPLAYPARPLAQRGSHERLLRIRSNFAEGAAP